jgi:hypothetical protein
MALADIPGYKEVIARFGHCHLHEFKEIRVVLVETYFEEDRERFEKLLVLTFKGRLGAIEVTFGNISDFRLLNVNQISGFDVAEIRSDGWEEKNFKFFDFEDNAIFGYAEAARVCVCDNKFI